MDRTFLKRSCDLLFRIEDLRHELEEGHIEFERRIRQQFRNRQRSSELLSPECVASLALLARRDIEAQIARGEAEFAAMTCGASEPLPVHGPCPEQLCQM